MYTCRATFASAKTHYKTRGRQATDNATLAAEIISFLPHMKRAAVRHDN
jgi:hypothetical protein